MLEEYFSCGYLMVLLQYNLNWSRLSDILFHIEINFVAHEENSVLCGNEIQMLEVM